MRIYACILEMFIRLVKHIFGFQCASKQTGLLFKKTSICGGACEFLYTKCTSIYYHSKETTLKDQYSEP